MSGGADLFRVLSHTENVGVLVADTRPSLVVDRSGSRLLWANAAGAAFFGVATVDRLTALRFSSASPFARRIAALDDMLVSGQDRIERLPLQRGLLPRPTICKASRVVADGVKAILLTIVDGTGSLAGDPATAFATLAATALPEVPPEPVDEAVAEEATPEPAQDIETTVELIEADVAEIDAVAPDDAIAETVAETIEAAGETEAADIAVLPQEEPAAEAPETIVEDISPEPVEDAVEDTSVEAAEAAVEDVPSEPAETAPPVASVPAFSFPTHGRAVRFVFELDPQLAFTFVSADLAQTVGPGMADILGRTWTDVASRLEFDPAGRIAEALGRRDTFTGLTVDWPVDGQNLRVPSDLAGMPVFGRERAFRGYRGFGVLKTGAAFDAPVPAEPIAAKSDESITLPPARDEASDDIVYTVIAPAAAAETDVTAEPVPDAAPEVADDLLTAEEATSEEALPPPEEPVVEVEDAVADVTAEPDQPEPDLILDLVEDFILEEPGAETPDIPADVVAEPDASAPIDTMDAIAEDAEAEAPNEPAEVAAESDLSEPADIVEDAALDEPVVAEEDLVEADELPEPLALVTPPPESDVEDVLELVPPAPVADVAAVPVVSRRPTFASLTGDKARALSKPERDAFDKIAEALADAFGPRILAEPADRTAAPPAPIVNRKADVATDIGPSVDIALLDKLPVALAILRGGDIIHANRAFLDLCGYPDVASIDADGGFAQVFEGAALSREAAIPTVRRRDGVEIPVSARLHSLPMEGGIASLLVVQETAAATSRDRFATAEQRAEDMEAILDTATDGVLVLDQKGLVIGANKSAEALFGNERSHMVGMAFVDLLAPESHRSALDYLDGLGRNALSSVLNDGREVIGRVAGGGLVPLFMTVGRVSATKFCAVLRDITQWKRAEEELTSAKKAAENASSQKSDFLAKMSHEIRTPLNAIIGFSEVMMEERFGPVGNDRYKEYLRDIHVSGTHIMSLVNDLLDLSKIEAGKLELTFEAVGLNDVVRECAALMQPQANRERIIIRTSLSSSLPPVVADNRSLRQIILNLLSNAVKFNSAGGQVIVSTLYEETGEVVLRVRDTGQGMSEGDIVKAMEPFRQLSTSRTGGGTGLGLPLTKALVEANRAAFQIDSTPGQGTMIQITFPSTRVLAE